MDSLVKKSLKSILLLNLVILVLFSSQISSEKPCATRPIPDRSVVCVCNDTYCDDVTRQPPTRGQYVTYTSSKAGSRLKKSLGILQSNSATHDCCSLYLQLEPGTQYQTIEGFGGAVTDSAGINWRSLSDDLQKHLINSYFGDNGLQYSVIRIPIGGCDFSTRPYAYNELPEDDILLTNYTLAYEDYQYKIPMIKAILNTSSTPVHIVATTWSPPAWMKTNDKYKGASRLKTNYYQTFADYHYKFIEKYAAEGIKIWGITTTNEPTNGVIPIARFNSLGWTANNMGRWIINHLGPTIRNSTFKDLKIITVDDQRFTLPYWFNVMLEYHPSVIDWIDGVAVHYYADIITPPSFLSLVSETHPDKFILATEACEGSFSWQKKVDIGSWSRARNYIVDIIVDLNHNVVGWLDWNMCLDQNGGPNWAENFVDSPILVFPERGEFIKQPMFYAMGHFSKFLPRGSKRIKVLEQLSSLSDTVKYTAFITPNNTIVVVLYNENNEEVSVRIKHGNKNAVVDMEALSAVTVEFNYTS